MTETPGRSEELSPLKRALLAIDKLQARVRELEQGHTEPIAVVGMGCRLPGGVDSPDALWRLLESEVDAISVVPSDRWEADALYDPDPNKRGTAATRWGGFLDGIDQFDPDFFGISPREARQMDPQQRMLLEVSIEALEDAGLSLQSLGGSRTGVFVGAHSHSSDYSLLQFRDLREIDTYTSTGTAHSILANRLSYLLDLQGPSLTVDTACSSSLVALHLAIQSLRNGECNAAVAAGVNLVLSPESTVAFSRLNMMASDGRCKTFDAAANGFVRGEGCGVVVLKRLSDALSSGDRVLAVVRGSAVNQDGSTNGLTAPNGISQQKVLRDALKNAGVEASHVTYVETHGTGTSLGDPIEVEALGAVLGVSAEASVPCVLGALKTNIGHLEGAAGIAGFIKAVLCLHHGKIPPNLHFRTLNPHISLDGTRFVLAGRDMEWKRAGERHVAGVSSFGFGGTNAHVVLEEWEPVQEKAVVEQTQSKPDTLVLPLSARHPESLRKLARAYASYLRSESVPSLGDVCYTAAVRRAHHSYRLAVAGRNPEEIAQKLEDAAAGELPALSGSDPREGVVFVFSGQGSQWPGMGASLLEHEPAFRAAVQACDEHFRPLAGWSIVGLLEHATEDDLARTDIVQALLFAVQVGLVAVWKERGINPDAVIGHSFGEIAAAYTAGALSLEDAVAVIYHRGALMRDAEEGRMAAVGLTADDLRDILEPYEGKIGFGAFNGPTATVITGEAGAVEEIAGALGERGVFVRLLPGTHAFHSAYMDAPAVALRRALEGLSPRTPAVPFYSTVTGGLLRDRSLDAAYWAENVRKPVCFAQALQSAAAEQYPIYLELAPHPVLGTPMRQVLEQSSDSTTIIASTRRSDDPVLEMARALCAMYEAGASIAWERIFPAGRHVSLPRYAWRRDRYWLQTRHPEFVRAGGATDPKINRFLGARVDAAVPFFEALLRGSDLSILDGHRLNGRVFMPMVGFLEMASAAGRSLLGEGGLEISDLEVSSPLFLDDLHDTQVQLVPRHVDADQFQFEVFSRGNTADAAESWVKHSRGQVRRRTKDESGSENQPSFDALVNRTIASTREPGSRPWLERHGIDLGNAFESVAEIRRGEGEVLCRIAGPSEDRLAVALMAALEVLPTDLNDAYIATGLSSALFPSATEEVVWCHAELNPTGSSIGYEIDLTTFDSQGARLHSIKGLKFARSRTAATRGAHDADDWLYQVEWEEEQVSSRAPVSGLDLEAVRFRLDASSQDGEGVRRHQRYLQLLPHLDRLCSAYVINALLDLGYSFEVGRRQTAAQIADELSIEPRFRPLLRRMLEMLEADGFVSEVNGSWESNAAPSATDVYRLADELFESFPECEAELEVTRKCGEQLADVLRGQTDPLSLLFPDGSTALASRIYSGSPFSAPFAALAGDALAAVASGFPADESLSVLEIGAGTGGTTDKILSRVLPDQLKYVFTDISPAFIEAARVRYEKNAWMRFDLLNIENDPLDQGFRPHSFDVIVAANVIHATRDLDVALRHIHTLLKPGGVLLLQEVTYPARWIELTFGLTEGWWRFTASDARASQPLLTPEQWTTTLHGARFEAVETMGVPNESGAYPSAQSVVCAKAASSASTDYLVVYADRSGVADALTDLCREVGVEVVLVNDGAHAAGAGSGTIDLENSKIADVSLQRAVSGRDGDCRGIVYLSSLEVPAHAGGDTLSAELARLRRLVDAVEGETSLSRARVWAVTRSAQGVTASDAPHVNPAHAAFWGLGRVAALAHPEKWGGLIDLEHDLDVQQAARFILDGVFHADDDQIAYRSGRRKVARLRRAQSPEVPFDGIRSDASYLITGGMGGLGVEVAQWMASQGATHLVLLGRTPLDVRRRQADAGDPHARHVLDSLDEIRAGGVQVDVETADVADEPSMRALFARFGRQLPPLRGILHLAADVRQAEWSELDHGAFATMLRPKIEGTVLLSRLAADAELDFFVNFSSSTALLGARGMAHYAAANAYQDAFAIRQRAAGQPVSSVGWGLWNESRGLEDSERRDVVRGGLVPMDAVRALSWLTRIVAGNQPHLMVADVDWQVLRPLYESRRSRPFLLDVHNLATADNTSEVATETDLRAELDALSGEERRTALVRYVQKTIGAALGRGSGTEVEPGRGFFEMGFDSLLAMEVRARLQKSLHAELPATLLFTYPTINSLTERLLKLMYGASTPAAMQPVQSVIQDQQEDLDSLSEDELAALLSAELEAANGDGPHEEHE